MNINGVSISHDTTHRWKIISIILGTVVIIFMIFNLLYFYLEKSDQNLSNLH